MIYVVITLIAMGGPVVAALVAAREITTNRFPRPAILYPREIQTTNDAPVKIEARRNRVVVSDKWIFVGRVA